MKKKVLVFPCGSEIGLEIARSLAGSTHFEMYGASSLDDHGKYVYKNYIDNIPFIDEDNFLSEIKRIINVYQIDFIFPAHDSVVLKLAEHSDELNAIVVTSPYKTCKICRSKALTYKRLEHIVDVPIVFNETNSVQEFPVFAKPVVGQGSKGARKITNVKELSFLDSDVIVTEYLPGPEYTVDCFTNRHGKLLFAKGRCRNRISNGISVNSFPKEDERFWQMAEKINSRITFRGVWFFQVKERLNGEYVLMEVAPRIAGTMGLYRAHGVNFAKLSLFDAMNYDVTIIHNDFHIEIDRALFARYTVEIDYDIVYLDFDDTMIVGGMVNLPVINFVYQCQNKGKKVVLITKHTKNICATLKKYSIDPSVFSEIVYVNKDNKKHDYIKSKKAIFIDDSYTERLEIRQKCGIPVFDVDAVESLIDWKN